jgi:hypothetical protein
MNNGCEDKTLELTDGQELTQEETIENCTNDYVLPFLEIPFEAYDADEFAKGMQEYSNICGKLSALINVGGISGDSALNYLMNREILENTLEVAKINADMNIQMSKNKSVLVENSQI